MVNMEQERKVKVWAHRGASAYRPENTLEAFALAVEQQADGVELDVQLSRDGEVVVVHDEQLERVSDGTGFVKDHTLQELKALSFNRTHPECVGAAIPTLEEVYDLLKPTGLTVNVELKTSVFPYEGIEEKVLELAARMGMEERVLYSSFGHCSLVRLKKLNPAAETGLLYSDGWIGVPEYGRNTVGVDALHPPFWHLQDGTLAEQAKQLGLRLHVWTVDEPVYMQMLVRQGVDALITNKPDLCRDVLGRG
ncbi:MAG: glycerophosphodiester phosphodiesterase [Eubacteriales bacterium]|nr:glycerophosphodiester phosphodiesterase [Eubacteriales bacterium]